MSGLILPRLPFPIPDVYRKAERSHCASEQQFKQETIVPDMQIKLLQGFGRAIRTAEDTCAVAILDHRAFPVRRYHQAVLDVLPPCRRAGTIEEIEAFIREKKSPDYFLD